jgi:hypothetical protein
VLHHHGAGGVYHPAVVGAGSTAGPEDHMRIRTIKPEFWTHPIMARQEPEIRLLALALLNYADDEGYFLADPMLVRGACCPFVESSSTIRRWLARLSDVGWIALSSETPHGVIGRVVNFDEHQRIDRAKPSQIRIYWIDDESTIDRRLIDDASLLEGKGKEGKGTGNRERKEERFAPPSVEEVRSYIAEKGYGFDAESFVAYYQSNGWRVGKSAMKDWKAACMTWERRRKTEGASAVLRAPQRSPSNAARGSDFHKFDGIIERSPNNG